MSYRALALGVVVGFLFAIAPSCGSSAGRCNQTNCRGCCLAGVACQDPVNERACGSGGRACSTCAPGQSCMSGTCGVSIGSTCALDQDCSGTIAAPVCKTATSTSGAPYPGGYCTSRSCASCPTGSLCANLGCYGEADQICLKSCSVQADCRDGYQCLELKGRGVNVCWLASLPSCAPARPNLTGAACASDADCQNPPADGFCQTGFGFVEGYCSAPCDVGGDEHCGTNGACVLQAQGSFCLAACLNPGGGQSNCRVGYVCTARRTTSLGVCFPNCRNDPTVCAAGFICGTDGYCH